MPKLHLPYGKLSTRQIHRARCQARSLGPGSVPEQKIHHRVRTDISKVDHFIESEAMIRDGDRKSWDARGPMVWDKLRHPDVIYPR